MLVEHNCPVCGVDGAYESDEAPQEGEAVDCLNCNAALFVSKILERNGDVFRVECENESGV